MIGALPDTWRAAKLSHVCQINPRGKSELAEDDGVSFVPMAAVSEFSGTIVDPEIKLLRDVQKGFTPFQEGDVLFAKITPCMENGKAAIARNLVNHRGYGSTEFHVLRPSPVVLAEWIFAIIRTQEFRRAAASSFQGAVGQQRVTASFLEGFRIPIPPLSEQRHIVEILQAAEAVRRLRAEAEAKTAQLISSVFSSIFGGPESWGADHKLGDLVEIVGGGTPSRSVEHYFSGAIPWATSKDVKRLYLADTEEHVTDEAVQLSATNVVPSGTVLVVVKSKILAHTLPMAITEVPMCFGQDVKGLIPIEGVQPEFLVYALKAQLGRILARARGANTEGLTLEALKSLTMPRLVPNLMERFRKSCEESRALERATSLGDSVLARASAAVSAYSFSGQLTAEWRSTQADSLAAEADERDATLLQAGRFSHASKRVLASKSERPVEEQAGNTPGDLNREQCVLILHIQHQFGASTQPRYFSAQQLSQSIDGALRRNPHTIEGHLAVLAARGLVIPVSREEQTEDTGQFVFGNAYRLPMKHHASTLTDEAGSAWITEGGKALLTEGTPGDHSRLRELERLANELDQGLGMR